jgi:hypothetical protein
MDQEAALIQKIDRLKIQAADENRDRNIVKLLEKVCFFKINFIQTGYMILKYINRWLHPKNGQCIKEEQFP